MRGSYSAGVMSALQAHGLNDKFKYIIGESAGAMVAAYFMTKQATFEEGGSIFSEHLCSSRFIDVKKVPKILDIDYAMHIANEVKPLNYEALSKSKQELHLPLTNADTLQSKIFKGDVDYKKALKAAISVPIIYDQPVQIDGQGYVDGGLSHALPYDYVKSLDADLYVMILTNPFGYRYHDSRMKKVLTHSKFMAHLYPQALLERIGSLEDMYNSTLREVEVDQAKYDNVEALFPSDASRLVPMLEIRANHVRSCYLLGNEDANEFLSRSVVETGTLI